MAISLQHRQRWCRPPGVPNDHPSIREMLERLLAASGTTTADVDQLRKRRDELIEANNRLVEEKRAEMEKRPRCRLK